MTPTLELTLHVPEALHDRLISGLEDFGFEAFLQETDRLKAYLPAPQWSADRRARLAEWLRARGVETRREERIIEPEDWNRQWERSIRPLPVGPFLVRPTWTETPPEDAEKIPLLIDPKMSFGTGYHESTRLILRLLPDLIRGGERVLDAGAGTGILAIAAVKLGAAEALAFDVDAWTVENAAENFHLNAVADRITFRLGSIEVIPETGFDLILANINRNVLLDLFPAFAGKVRAGGHVVLAGLLRTDRARMLEAAAPLGLTLHREAEEGAWWSVVFKK